MRRVLGSVLPALGAGAIVLALTGCGDTTVDHPVSDSAPPSSSSPADRVEVVELLTETAAGGQVGDGAALSDEAALSAYAATFKTGGMSADLTDLFHSTKPTPGMVLYAEVVAVGCDAPTTVDVTTTGGTVDVTAAPVADPKPECLAPMTTVAVVSVPQELAG
jgi:hypothetical protein